jgi:hypothetical protein
VNNAGAITLKRRAVRMRGLAVTADGKRLVEIAADRARGGKRNKPRWYVWLVHARAGCSAKPKARVKAFFL